MKALELGTIEIDQNAHASQRAMIQKIKDAHSIQIEITLGG